MVISGVNTVTYNGDGITTAWPYTYEVTDASEIRIQLNNADGTAVIVESDYYVDLVNSTVYYPGYAPGSEPPEAEQPPKVQEGQTITVYREIPITQESDLGDKWPFEVIEKGLDKLTMIAQQIDSGTKRTIDNALASMELLADVVIDSGELQHITDQLNAIDDRADDAEDSADAAATSEANALSYKNAAATSATNASNSASSATATAAALTNYLATKETLTAPAVDPTLTISGAAADALVTGEIATGLLDLREEKIVTATGSGRITVDYPISIGDVISVTNISATSVEMQFRLKGSTTSLQAFVALANTTTTVVSEVDAETIAPYFTAAGTIVVKNLSKRVPVLESDVKTLQDDVSYLQGLDLNLVAFEKGGINNAGVLVSDPGRIRTKEYFVGRFKITCPEGTRLNRYCIYDEFGAFSSETTVNATSATVTVPDGYYAKFTIADTDIHRTELNPEDVTPNLFVSNINNRVAQLENTAPLDFEYHHDLPNISAYLADVDYDTPATVRTKVETAFDALVSSYPTYITKIDAVSLTDLTPPGYVTYSTYLYKFDGSAFCGESSLNRKKIFLFAGEHGNEPGSVINTYLIMRSLIENAATDPNWFKLFQVYDFYVLPALNGWGCDNVVRWNYNGVNINRNYPTSVWTLSGEPFQPNYSGATAGSEYETQLVIQLVNAIKPDIVIDHHSYGLDGRQFYAIGHKDKNMTNIYRRSYFDCISTFKKHLPQYFGGAFDAITGTIGDGSGGMSSKWFEENNVNGMVLEVGMCINYDNGQVAQSQIDFLGNTSMSMAVYTVQNVLMHIIEYSSRILS